MDWMVGAWLLGLVLGIACAVGSMLIVRGAPAARAAALLVVGGAVVAMQAVRVRMAYADDGGWSECVASDGSPCTGIGGLFDWLSSPGANVVIAQGAVGGVAAAVGALLGVGLGAGMAGLAAAVGQTAAAAGSTSAGPSSTQTQEAPGAPSVVGGDAQPYPNSENISTHMSEVDHTAAAAPHTGAPHVPHQDGWPDTSAHPHVGADQDAAASAATEWPHGGGDVGSSSPPESGGDWGAGAARTAPSLGIEDLLPEEPEKKRQDGETGPESQPPVPPQR